MSGRVGDGSGAPRHLRTREQATPDTAPTARMPAQPAAQPAAPGTAPSSGDTQAIPNHRFADAMTSAKRTAKRWTGNALVATGAGLSVLGLAGGGAALWQAVSGPESAVVVEVEQPQQQRQQEQGPAVQDRSAQRTGWTVRDCVGDLAGSGASAGALQDICGAAVASYEQGGSAQDCDQAAYWAVVEQHGVEGTYQMNGAITQACDLATQHAGTQHTGALPPTTAEAPSDSTGPQTVTVKPAESKREHNQEVALLAVAGTSITTGGLFTANIGRRLRRNSQSE